MRIVAMAGSIWLTLALVACAVGADQASGTSGRSGEAVKVARSGDRAARSKTNQQQAAKKTGPPTPSWLPKVPTELWQPSVVLSGAHKSTCVKLVGDSVGDLNTVDVAGQQKKLSQLLSDRMTVLVFWSDKSPSGREQFQRLPVDVLGRYAVDRVKVIAVNVGGDVATTRKLTGDAADKIASLVDAKSELFHAFASSRSNRTYLLDAQGKILWFDVEYSQGMVKDLSNAIAWHLKAAQP